MIKNQENKKQILQILEFIDNYLKINIINMSKKQRKIDKTRISSENINKNLLIIKCRHARKKIHIHMIWNVQPIRCLRVDETDDKISETKDKSTEIAKLKKKKFNEKNGRA